MKGEIDWYNMLRKTWLITTQYTNYRIRDCTHGEQQLIEMLKWINRQMNNSQDLKNICFLRISSMADTDSLQFYNSTVMSNNAEAAVSGSFIYSQSTKLWIIMKMCFKHRVSIVEFYFPSEGWYFLIETSPGLLIQWFVVWKWNIIALVAPKVQDIYNNSSEIWLVVKNIWFNISRLKELIRKIWPANYLYIKWYIHFSASKLFSFSNCITCGLSFWNHSSYSLISSQWK